MRKSESDEKRKQPVKRESDGDHRRKQKINRIKRSSDGSQVEITDVIVLLRVRNVSYGALRNGYLLF